MRIAFVITRAEMGGAQVHVLDLVQGLRAGLKPLLITGERGYLTEECERLGVEHHVLPDLVQPLRPWLDLKALAGATRLLRRLEPDLVHCHTSKAGIIGRLAARICRIPAVFTAHTWSFADGTSRLWKLVGKPSERVSASWSQKVIAVSDSNRRLAVEQGVVPAGKIVTVHNGIADTRWRAQPAAGDIPEIVMVARFAPQKNQAELVEALAGIDLPYQLTLVGDGPTRQSVEELVDAHRLRAKVRFLGVRNDTDEILARASLFVLATNWEGFPITILEAMRAGLPVIATDVDGVREAVTDGESGILYGRGQVNQLRSALVRLLRHGEVRAAFGEAGRERYEKDFTREVMLRRTEGVYQDVFATSKHAGTVLAGVAGRKKGSVADAN